MGIHVIVLPDLKGNVDLAVMMNMLADSGINEILVEAGNGLNGALIAASLVDEIVFYLAPHLLGNEAQGMFKLPELIQIDQKKILDIQDVRMIGSDIRIIARPS